MRLSGEAYARTDDPVRVLYVGQDADASGWLEAALEDRETAFGIDAARSVAEARRRLATDGVACVVADPPLADGTATELLAAIRGLDADLPVLLRAGNGEQPPVGELADAGLTDCTGSGIETREPRVVGNRIEAFVGEYRTEGEASEGDRRFRETLERVTDAVYAVDGEWRIVYWNSRMADRTGRSAEEVTGEILWEAFPAIRGTELEDRYREAMRTRRAVSFETYLEPFEYWIEVSVYPDENGLSIYSREITERKERERELREQRAITESTLDAQSDVFYLFDESGTFLRWNDQLADVTGYADEEIADMHPLDFVPDEHAGLIAEAIADVFDGTKRVVESALVTKDGERIPYEFTGSRVADEDGSVVGLAGVGRDISTRKERERRLRSDAAYLRSFYEVTTDAAAFDGKVRRLLAAGCERLSFDVGVLSRVEESTYEVRAVHAPDGAVERGDRFDLAETLCEDVVERGEARSFANAADAGKRAHRASRARRAESYLGVPVTVDGERYGTLDFWSPSPRESPVTDAELTLARLMAQWIGHELSRTRAHRELERSRDLLEKTQQIAHVGGVEFDVPTGELRWTDETRRIHEVPADYEPSFAAALEFYHPDDRETIRAAIDRAIERGEAFDHELRLVTAEGNERWVRIVGEPHRQDGEVVSLRGTVQDVTDRKERRRRFEAIFNHTYQFTGLMEPDGTLVEANETALRFGGIEREDVIGKPFWEARWWTLSTETRERLRRAIGRAAAGEFVRYEVDVRGETGTATIDFSIKPITNGQGDVVLLIPEGRDITDRKERERELREERNLSDRMLETNPVGIAVLDGEGEFVRANASIEAVFGTDEGELVGRRYDSAEWRLYDGDDHPVPAQDHPVNRTLETGEPIRDWEGKFERGDGGSLWVSINAAPIADDEGETTHVVLAAEDVTERKRRERELQRKLRSLKPLDRYSTVVRRLVRTVADKSTVEGIERAVCETFAAFDSRLFAVVGDFSPGADQFSPRTWAGVEREELDALLNGPFGEEVHASLGSTAAETRTVQVLQNVAESNDDGPGFRAVAFVPLSYNNAVYGVLSLYAARPFAFDRDEVVLLEELGRTIGFALAVVRNRQLLYANVVTELELRIADPDAFILYASDAADCSLTLEHVLPLEDGTYLAYLEVEGTSPERIVDLASNSSEVERTRTLADAEAGGKVELILGSSSPITTVAEYGIEIDAAVGRRGAGTLAVRVPQGTDVRATIDRLGRAFASVEFVSKRDVKRSPAPPSIAATAADDVGLTARQREALRTAFHAGYFKWPRDSTAEDVSASMGITPPTFHYHLRAAERKLVTAFVDGGPA
ncbi:PAS domain S-box protein [Halegenticoccus soli]|uniref:PAS domain S-box protein n=1 Tax=Halegenticoccus soli TaxID=1985678 RepID=UPI000C6D4169|nr:PAS domain S-box protein [Halegenticoccus soli]